MKILFLASECSPIIKVGGLADVVGSLPKALEKLDVDVSVAIPFYGIIKDKNIDLELAEKDIPVFFNQKKESFNIWKTLLPHSKVPLFLIENKNYFQGKDIYVEEDPSKKRTGVPRFLFFSACGKEMAKRMKVDIIHCHDWHVGITPFLCKDTEIKTLLTIHNLKYQGRYPAKTVNDSFKTNFSGEVNCLKQGILSADFVNTVSPNYAKEILTPQRGEGLERYLQKRKDHLVGIVNGIDYDHFNPKTDPFLPQKYSLENLDARKKNKEFLQKKCFSEVDLKVPLLGIVSRLAEQKGIDLIQEIAPSLMNKEIQFILLGTGEKKYEEFFQKASQKYKKRLWAKIDFNEELAHQIYGGTDIFLMPSKFEPCGLGQQIAMRYGAVSVARAVGGIKDTISEIKKEGDNIQGTGFLFSQYSSQAFLESIERALSFYNKKEDWKQIQINGMKKDLSWEKSAKEYLELFKKILKD